MEVNEYAEAAHLLEAVQQLSQHFQSFVSIPKVAELGGRLTTLQRALQVRIRINFGSRFSVIYPVSRNKCLTPIVILETLFHTKEAFATDSHYCPGVGTVQSWSIPRNH